MGPPCLNSEACENGAGPGAKPFFPTVFQSRPQVPPRSPVFLSNFKKPGVLGPTRPHAPGLNSRTFLCSSIFFNVTFFLFSPRICLFLAFFSGKFSLRCIGSRSGIRPSDDIPIHRSSLSTSTHINFCWYMSKYYFYRQKHSENWAAFLWFGRLGEKNCPLNLIFLVQLGTKDMALPGGATSKSLDRSKTVQPLTSGAAWRCHVFCPQLYPCCQQKHFSSQIWSVPTDPSKQSENLQNLEKSDNNKNAVKKGRCPCPFYTLIKSSAINVH